ncbi:Choline monooxygenase, chloroplastic [Apostasia shenzhenica]|uniref:Choline monooxygenase, chloroplastic n=1 Tax=Apostasia shenzhenica TaxID=1088818 RepID=A0A2I0BDB7_9ASPA|nr:Choline monooxygenase, chloroplastic [Apostasia shenzhenica]
MAAAGALFVLAPTNTLNPRTLNLLSCSSLSGHRAPSSRAPHSRSTQQIWAEEVSSGGSGAVGYVRLMLDEFDPTIPLPEALTPPSFWYTDPSFLDLEFERVFFRGWQVAGCADQVKNPRDFFTGRQQIGECRICGLSGYKWRAFHNVCRHHASILAFGSGKKSCFECLYHGWTYGLDGMLLRATRITGMKNFNKNDFGLLPLNVATWGPFVLVNADNYMPVKQKTSSEEVGKVWLGSTSEFLSSNGIDTSLEYLCRRQYTIECNWKVFCDNYLDGGYHVIYAHGGLASGLKLDSYTTHVWTLFNYFILLMDFTFLL